MTLPRIIQPSEMRPGDVVTPAWSDRVSPFDAAIVSEVTLRAVTLYRPYATAADFTTGTMVTAERCITYTGAETYTIGRDRTTMPYTLWQRSHGPALREAIRLEHAVDSQRSWIKECGGTLAGYLAHYDLGEHESVKAIYAADQARLLKLEREYDDARRAADQEVR